MPAQFISEDLQKFWEFGHGLRHGAALPRYADLDLMEIHGLSSKVVILDVQEPGPRFLNRFVGTKIAELFGETTGKFVDEVDLGEFKDQLINVYRETIATGVPHWSLAQVIRKESIAGVVEYKKRFAYERLVFPLTGADGEIAHLAGIVIGRKVEEAGAGFTSDAAPWPD